MLISAKEYGAGQMMYRCFKTSQDEISSCQGSSLLDIHSKFYKRRWGKTHCLLGEASKRRDILINELQVTSYKLISLRVAFIARVTRYDLFLLHELRVIFCIRVTSSCLLRELRVTFYIRVTSYCLFHELRVTIIARVASYCLLHELRVTVYCMSYTL